MIEFSASDITNTLDQESRNLIADLILAWARYDSLVSQWTYRSYGMSPDEGSLFIGNMDTKAKLDKLKALFTHYQKSGATKIAALSKESQKHADVRNTICHKTCGGHSKSDPERLVFSDGRVFKTMPGNMLVELIHLNQIRGAIAFATKNADAISKMVDELSRLQDRSNAPSRNSRSSSPNRVRP